VKLFIEIEIYIPSVHWGTRHYNYIPFLIQNCFVLYFSPNLRDNERFHPMSFVLKFIWISLKSWREYKCFIYINVFYWHWQHAIEICWGSSLASKPNATRWLSKMKSSLQYTCPVGLFSENILLGLGSNNCCKDMDATARVCTVCLFVTKTTN
jgi:hypothetical protein